LDVEAKLKERISWGQDVTLLDLELNLLVEQQVRPARVLPIMARFPTDSFDVGSCTGPVSTLRGHLMA
jgi:hypothetical protein